MDTINTLNHYSVEMRYTSSSVLVGDNLTLAEAKRLARREWDARPGMIVIITSHRTGRESGASQPHGRGMLWGH